MVGGGGVPTFPGLGWGGTDSQVWMGGDTYLPRSGGGYLLSGLDGGVPTFPGPGGVPTQGWMGGWGYLPRYPPPE